MKLPIYDANKNRKGERELPVQFSESFRPDLIKRAVLALQSAARQAYGASPRAGMRHSTYISKQRKNYRGCYGFGISRTARKILSRKGTRMSWVGAFTPQTVGGHRSHPPKSETILEKNINIKENQKAIRSAIAATVDKKVVEARGRSLPKEFPFILDSSFEKLSKTQEVEKVITSLGLNQEVERFEKRKIRAGKGKMRGRKYQNQRGLLLVVGENCPLLKSAKNLSGIDVVQVNALNAELLAPGCQAGRITLWTEKAIEALDKNKLFC